MSGADAIFRELFVELPRQLLEAAVREAEQRAAPVPPRSQSRTSLALQSLDEGPARRFFLARFGAVALSAKRSPMDDVVRVAVRFPCGHVQVEHIPECAIEGAPRPNVFEAIFAEHERKGRGCFCVQREAP